MMARVASTACSAEFELRDLYLPRLAKNTSTLFVGFATVRGLHQL